MFFLFSKLFWFVAQPGNFLLLLLVTGAILHARTRYKKTGLRLVWTSAGVLTVILILPVGAWLAKPLEDRYAHPAWPAHVDGILVLGGGADPQILSERGMPLSLPSTARILAGVEALRRYPNARLVFSGGSGQLLKTEGSEAGVALTIFKQAGVDASRVTLEARSRNTWENIAFSKELLLPKPGQTWLLVTAAYHMPRAMGVARRQNWTMTAWPSDYVTTDNFAWPGFPPSLSGSLGGFEVALREWIGLAAYRMTGKTDALIP